MKVDKFKYIYFPEEKKSLRDIIADKRIIVFGTGKSCTDLLSRYALDVEYFVDNDTIKWGMSINGIDICCPELLSDENKESIFIFIASMFYEKIRSQLIKMGFIENKHFYCSYRIENDYYVGRYPGFTDKSNDMSIFTSSLRIEASSLCQLKCVACPTANGLMDKVVGKGFLMYEDFKKVIDNNDWIKYVELSNNGEIFLNTDLLKIMRYADENDVVLTSDNGANLNTVSDEVLEGLVKYRFRSINCSIDGASDETYKVYRVNGKFDKVIENIKKINHHKEVYDSVFPHLNWQFIIFGHNEHEIDTARRMAKELNMTFSIKLNYSSFSPIKDHDYVKKVSGLEYITRGEYSEGTSDVYDQSACLQLWTQPQINWDGKLLGCCVNYHGAFDEDCFSKDIYSSINCEKMRYARQMLMGSVTSRENIPCSKCYIYEYMKKNNRWIDPKIAKGIV